jgi:hypothetical protein
MVKYKPTQNIFLTALLIVLIIVIILFFGVISYDDYKRTNLEEDIKILNQQLILDELYENYLEHSENDDLSKKCEILAKQLNSQYKINRTILDRLRNINKDAIVSTDNYIKFMYVVTNIKLWMHYTNFNDECNNDTKILLYFYTEEKQSGSEQIKADTANNLFEKRLDNFNKSCKNSVIFALPFLPEIIVLDQLITDYNITRAPAIVYEDDVIYNSNDLDNIVCEE